MDFWLRAALWGGCALAAPCASWGLWRLPSATARAPAACELWHSRRLVLPSLVWCVSAGMCGALCAVVGLMAHSDAIALLRVRLAVAGWWRPLLTPTEPTTCPFGTATADSCCTGKPPSGSWMCCCGLKPQRWFWCAAKATPQAPPPPSRWVHRAQAGGGRPCALGCARYCMHLCLLSCAFVCLCLSLLSQACAHVCYGGGGDDKGMC